MASYLYYWGLPPEEQSPISDTTFDFLCRDLSRNWSKVTHPLKHLANEDDLSAGTGHQIRKDQYPEELIDEAREWAK